MRHRIGWRLTAWYGLSVLLALACSTFVALRFLRPLLTGDTFRSVADTGVTVAALVAGVPGAPGDGSGGDAGGTRRERVQMGLANPALVLVAPASGQLVQVENAQGVVVSRSANLEGGTLPLPPAPRVPARGLRPAPGSGPPLAWVSVPLHRHGAVVGAVQVAKSLGPVYAFLRQARRVLLWVDVAGAGLAAGVGLLLANQALAPVRRIIAAARRIDAANLEARLPEDGPRDELRDLATVFNQALERIAEAARARQRFVAVASHELRTPLAIIQGYAELLGRRQTQGAEVTLQAATAIREEAARMRRLTSRLLVLARGEHAERGRWERLDLAELAAGVHETMAMVAEGRTLRLAAPGPVAVRGDAERLQQIAVILVDNALKYTPAGGCVTMAVGASGVATLSVEDDGPGIPPDLLPRLFEPFFRGDEAHARGQDGFGLGLSIAQLLAREHGGEVRVRSEVGRGSCFTLVLPLAPPGPPPALP